MTLPAIAMDVDGEEDRVYWESYDPAQWGLAEPAEAEGELTRGEGSASSQSTKRPRLPVDLQPSAPVSREPGSSTSSESLGPWKKRRGPLGVEADPAREAVKTAYDELVSRFWDDIPIVKNESKGIITHVGSHSVPKPEYTVGDIPFLNTPCGDCDACTAMPRSTKSQAYYAAGLCLYRQAVLAGWTATEVYKDISTASPFHEERCECGASIIGTNFRTVCRQCKVVGCICRQCDAEEVDEAAKPLEEGSDLHKEWEGILGTLKSLGLDKICYLRTQVDIGWEDFIDQLQGVLVAYELWGPEASEVEGHPR